MQVLDGLGGQALTNKALDPVSGLWNVDHVDRSGPQRTGHVVPDVQIFGDLTSLKAFVPVGDISLDNYTAVFNRVPFWQFLMNSILISAFTVVLGLIVSSMCAFALARLKFRGRVIMLGVIIATLIVPFETLAFPLLWWVNKLPYYDGTIGWLDTYEVQIVPFIVNAFSIYLFYQYFDPIPKELDEAAIVDGAG